MAPVPFAFRFRVCSRGVPSWHLCPLFSDSVCDLGECPHGTCALYSLILYVIQGSALMAPVPFTL